jgi:hypothetical protein
MNTYDVRGLAAERHNQLIAEAWARRSARLARSSQLARSSRQRTVRFALAASGQRARDRVRAALDRPDSTPSTQLPFATDTFDVAPRSTEQLEDTRV